MRTLEELHVVQYDTVPRGHTYLHKAARRAANRGAEWYVSTAAGCGGSCTAAPHGLHCRVRRATQGASPTAYNCLEQLVLAVEGGGCCNKLPGHTRIAC